MFIPSWQTSSTSLGILFWIKNSSLLHAFGNILKIDIVLIS